MSIESELEDFFSQDINTVVEDSEKFREKLDIGYDAFNYLSKTENLGSFTTAATTGAGIALIAQAGWAASIGTLGQLGLFIGIVSTPIGWFAAAGAGGAATVLLTRHILKSIKNEVAIVRPKFINSPLDVLGSSICNYMCPVLLNIAYADGHISEDERLKVNNYFIDQWGINPNYVEELLNYTEANMSDFKWDGLSETLKEIEKSGDIKYSTMANEIIEIATEVMACDGEIHPHEQKEIDNLKKELCEDDFLTAAKKKIDNIFTN